MLGACCSEAILKHSVRSQQLQLYRAEAVAVMELAQLHGASLQVSGKGGKDVKGKAAPAKPKPAPAAAAAVPGKGSMADKAKAAAAAAAVAAAEAAAAKREQALATTAKVQGIRSAGGDAASVEQRLQVCPVKALQCGHA